MKIENCEVFGFEHAIRGMRNAHSSWSKSDSEGWGSYEDFTIGLNDLKLAEKLVLAGDDHGKFARQIIISADLTLPRYIWQEFDTYKVGTVRNSCSTIPTELQKRIFKLDQFETKGLPSEDLALMQQVLDHINRLVVNMNPRNKAETGRRIKKLLPEALLQKATVTMNYQVARHMYFGRNKHWLEEWHEICAWLETLPYAKELICAKKDVKEP